MGEASQQVLAAARARPRRLRVVRPKLGPKEQAFVVALPCTKPPEGRRRWTMQLLADRMVELELAPAISDEAVRRFLKRTSSSRGSTRNGDPDGRGRVRLLDGGRARPVRRGARPGPPGRLLRRDQQATGRRDSDAAADGAGKPERVDYEYERHATANLFPVTQPRGAWRHVDVTDRRTKHDFAQQLRDLVDRHFPDATTIRVVLDNLNSHTPAALYEAFPPAEARRIPRRLDFHYTPVHASWLNMAELEFSMLSRQCLNRRIGDRDALNTDIAAWETARNKQRATISWQFTVDDARRRLHRLYPS